MTDNIAVLDGYTKEVHGECCAVDLYLLVREDADLDGRFKAWDMEMQEFINVSGWNFTFLSEVASA